MARHGALGRLRKILEFPGESFPAVRGIWIDPCFHHGFADHPSSHVLPDGIGVDSVLSQCMEGDELPALILEHPPNPRQIMEDECFRACDTRDRRVLKHEVWRLTAWPFGAEVLEKHVGCALVMEWGEEVETSFFQHAGTRDEWGLDSRSVGCRH